MISGRLSSHVRHRERHGGTTADDGGPATAPPTAPHAGLALEQTLGHVTHARTLASLLTRRDDLRTTVLPIEMRQATWAHPTRRNWTLDAGQQARSAVRRAHAADPFAVLFVHTQVPAVLLGRLRRAIPTVVSIDATPLQYDQLGHDYGHRVSGRRAERVKHHLNSRCFDEAAHLVAWSRWAAQGLVDGYGVDPARITVVAPGVITDRWAPASPRDTEVVRLLFVGADLRRKGGRHLLEAFTTLRRRHGRGVELHLVTRTPVPPQEGVTVYSSLGPGSDELRALYQRCHVFCLPTLGDCLPMVLSEAGAAGLPLVSTTVGAISEIVQDGATGITHAPGDVDGLVIALDTLVADAELRERLGAGAAALVARDYDAVKNADVLVDVLQSVSRR